ncbi:MULTISPECIES: hypothetical protein [Mycolicibacter]|uniref:Uncharacterized protein n=2 Tax=Mycolicibacter TaxID=1073531 RepID=A0ABU5XMF0_9MYCO|nr:MULTISPECIES: hypothetical protein [unclassified Mycolicibacter]MEB3023386.1 hypothetical protein [Mycolicibacter sp. MYC098]MEB3033728.1 hypothetical protein [Mycolicibacter sp. MYC340]
MSLGDPLVVHGDGRSVSQIIADLHAGAPLRDYLIGLLPCGRDSGRRAQLACFTGGWVLVISGVAGAETSYFQFDRVGGHHQVIDQAIAVELTGLLLH